MSAPAVGASSASAREAQTLKPRGCTASAEAACLGRLGWAVASPTRATSGPWPARTARQSVAAEQLAGEQLREVDAVEVQEVIDVLKDSSPECFNEGPK